MIYVSIEGDVATVEIDGVRGTGKIISKDIRPDRHIKDDEIIRIGDCEYSVDVYMWYSGGDEDAGDARRNCPVCQEIVLTEWEGWTTIQDNLPPVRHGRNVLSVTTTLATEGQH